MFMLEICTFLCDKCVKICRLTLFPACVRFIVKSIYDSQLLVFTHVINSHVFQRKQKEAFA